MANKVLILSGGGAKGAFQAGVIKKLIERGWIPDAVAGVSVGALCGAMVATGRGDQLESVWSNISPDKVLRNRGKIPSAGVFLMHKLGILSNPWLGYYDNRPLREYLAKHIGSDFKCDYYCGTVDLKNGRYHAHRFNKYYVIHGDMRDEVLNAIIASTAIPVVFDPIKVGGRLHVDGGVRHMSPMGTIIEDFNPTEIVVVTCSRMNSRSEGNPRNIVDVAKQSLDILLAEIFDKDLREFQRINRLVRQSQKQGITLKRENGKEYKEYTAHLYQPQEDLGDSLNFSASQARRNIQIGRRATPIQL